MVFRDAETLLVEASRDHSRDLASGTKPCRRIRSGW
jgi:hypothetical protein